MTLRTTKDLVDRAVEHGVGVVAFNVITLEHAEAIATAAETTGLPVILQISENAVKFHGGLPAPIAAASAAIAAASSAEIALHLDHVEDFNLLAQAAACGFSSAMFDAGALHYDDNVAATKRAVAWAHAHGLWLEAELGYVGGKESAPRSAHAEGVRTDPAEAARYVTDTGVDALAVAVGSSHAMVTQSALLDLELIARLNSAVDVPLVLHGSSGVPLDQLALAVHVGMRKINVGTALNIAYTQAVREHLATSDAVDPRRYLGAARAAMVAAITPTLLAVSRA
jgi:fructose-bisphosphate aldolase class II